MKNKKALSGVVSAMIMIALIMAAGVVIWVFANNIINKNLEEAESCFQIYDKISINNDYTCYDYLNGEIHISIKVADISVDGILVGVSGEANSKSFTLLKTDSVVTGVKPYSGDYTDAVSSPAENSGETYILKFTEQPDSIELAPIINGKQCDVASGVYNIYEC